MSELVASFQSCCRLCLCDKTDTLVSVFGGATGDRSLSQKILAFVAVEINSSDKLSKMVCNPCVSKLESWQKFKDECSQNQDKLEQLLQSSTNASKLHDMSIQIKEEPADDDEEVVILNESAIPMIKNEPVESVEEMEPEAQMEDEEFDYPPPLTPYIQHSVEDDDSQTSQTSQNSSISESNNSRICAVCEKSFSTAYNRRKHEKHMHGMTDLKKTAPLTPVSTASTDGQSQTSAESETNQPDGEETMEKSTVDSEQQKIAFAAGLKLLQTNETPRAFEPLSKVEFSYIEKCKAMIRMYKTRVCACHEVSYNNLKGLLSHLRSVQIWFPVFTCYHCMITYTDRSTYTRHYTRHHKFNDEYRQGILIEGLIKLSNLRKRSEMKTRLYENFRCVKCRFVYSFYEDYVKHVNEDHIPSKFPVPCICKAVHNDVETYKKHVYYSCLVEFQCDLCSEGFSSNELFIKHAIDQHDNSEGFSLLQDDNFKTRRSSSTTRVTPPPPPDLIINTKRRSSFYNKAPILEPELEIEELEEKKSNTFKVRNPASSWKRTPTKCLSCEKVYSSYANMMRHYKLHQLEQQSQNGSDMEIDDSEKTFCYSCPDCGGMYDNEKWEKHLRDKHKEKSCADCDRVFQFQTELDQHRAMHLNLKVYRDSKTKSYKSTMLKSPNATAEIIHVCDRCDTTFSTNDELQKHQLLHETMPQLSPHKELKTAKVECTDCNLAFSGYRQLWEHDHANHPEKRTPQSKNYPKQCKYCDKMFYTGGSYFNHKQMHERIVLANTINETNEMPKTSKRSKQNNSEEDDEVDVESYHTCNHCFKVFASKSQLKKHNKSHVKSTTTSNSTEKGKGAKKVWCDSCHVSCDNMEALEQHRLEEHSTRKDANKSTAQPNQVFTCDVCVMTFTTKLALKKHKERHAQEIRIMSKMQTVYCKFCKSAFDSVPSLNKHMQDEHRQELEKTKTQTSGKKVAQYPCDICSKNFQSPTALYVHQGWHRRTTYGLTNKPKAAKTAKIVKQKDVPSKSAFQCSTCSAELPNNTALQIHILEKHRNVDAIILTPRCNTCKFDFKSQDEYEKHKRLHDFLEKQQNNVHLTASIKPKTAKPAAKDSNSDKPKLTCQHCGFNFTRADNLATHIRNIHNIVNGEYKCTQCDRVFDKQMSLTIHLKVHEKQKLITNSKNEKSREKPKSNNTKSAAYSCSICSMSFDLPKDLRTHTINAHPF